MSVLRFLALSLVLLVAGTTTVTADHVAIDGDVLLNAPKKHRMLTDPMPLSHAAARTMKAQGSKPQDPPNWHEMECNVCTRVIGKYAEFIKTHHCGFSSDREAEELCSVAGTFEPVCKAVLHQRCRWVQKVMHHDPTTPPLQLCKDIKMCPSHGRHH